MGITVWSVAALHFIKLGLIVTGVIVFIIAVALVEIIKVLKDKLRQTDKKRRDKYWIK